ncbi:acyltransferase family protein [Streptacidiphilus carbonis]|uniref:acyltransferase family protein n=1 Tax=Streptacidiphilus carbonis TaxID=105422 RepID=UPI000694546F|nr:acyltransferase [Streptacidiphilus carbonis]
MVSRPAAAAAPRLGWLDALRGVAALTVAVYHLALPFYWVPHARHLPSYGDEGIFGVLLFFLVSGYIVPASLERRGDVRAFWIGRICRIYPLIIAVVLAGLVLLPRAHSTISDYTFAHPLLSAAAHLTLLQDLLGVSSAINVLWTLSYEMVFYFLVSALFVLGWHRRSTLFALLFAVAALALGSVTAPRLLSTDQASTRGLVLAAVLVFLVALGCILTGSTVLVRAGAVALGLLGLVVVTTNGRNALFGSLMILATMFSGTVVYRAQHRQISRAWAAVSCAVVVLAGFLVGPLYAHGPALGRLLSGTWMGWSFAYVAAWAVFALGLALRHRTFPRVLTWLGGISFSVYLIHEPVIHGMNALLAKHGGVPRTAPGRILLLVAFTAALLLLSQLAYRLLELPGQRLGRRLVRGVGRLDARLDARREAGRSARSGRPAAAGAALPSPREDSADDPDAVAAAGAADGDQERVRLR